MTTTKPHPPAIAAYLAQLERELKPLPEAEREDVLRELASHLEDGLAAGQSPEALIAGMGPAREVAEALVSERLVAVDQRRSAGAIAWMFTKAAGLPFLWATLVLVALMVGNTYYLYSDLLTERRTPPGTVFFLMLYNLPAIMVVNLPIAALMAGLTGLPRLATWVSAPTMHRLYPRLIAGGLLVGLLLSGAGFMLNDRVVPQSNRLTVDLVRQFILDQSSSPEDARSPQERSLAELDQRLAGMRVERDALVAGNAPYKEIQALDDTLRRTEVDRHLKLALPAYTFSLMALGLALGTLIAGRRPVPVWVNVAVTFAATFAIYTVMSLARFSLAMAPVLAAWSPVILTLMLAVVLWAYARIQGKGVYAHV